MRFAASPMLVAVALGLLGPAALSEEEEGMVQVDDESANPPAPEETPAE